MKELNFVAIDLETAVMVERSSICEIGIAVVRDSQIVETKSWLVRPEGNRYCAMNVAIHHITPDMTENRPSFPEVWKEVEPYLSGQIVVAHNTAFDMYALRDALDKYRLPYPTFSYYCSFRVARYVYRTYSYSLPIICAEFGIPLDEHHRAGGDAEACVKVFIKSLDLAGVDKVDDLQEKFAFKCGQFAEGMFRPQLAKDKPKKKIDAGDIVGDPSQIDEGSYFYGKAVCFTGAFQYGTRRELLQRIVDIGGYPMTSVTKETDILVVGQQDYRVVGDSGMSSKQKKAMAMREKGMDIEIMSEVDFLSNL